MIFPVPAVGERNVIAAVLAEEYLGWRQPPAAYRADSRVSEFSVLCDVFSVFWFFVLVKIPIFAACQDMMQYYIVWKVR